MDLELRTSYWDDTQARSAFKDFILTTHGLDFSPWESHGYWDDAYTPFTFFSGGRVVSSVCLYLLKATLNGESTHLAQLSGVGTRPEYRRKGLNRRLTEIALEWAQGKQEGVFLFADADAALYYEKGGFRPVAEALDAGVITSVENRDGAIKLDPSKQDDLDKIYRYAQQRTPISNKLSIGNERLLMFHVIYTLTDHIYEIPELECLVFFKRERANLKIFDLVAEKIPNFGDVYPYIASREDKTVEFHFHTDKLGLGDLGTKPLIGSNQFVGEGFPMSAPIFPFTAHA